MLPHRSQVFSAPVAAADQVAVGDVLIPHVAGTHYVVATAANRGSRRSEAVALEASLTGIASAVEIQQSGTVDATVSGLGAGSVDWVRVSTVGRMERVTTPEEGDDIIGRCETDGRVHLMPGVLLPSMLGGGEGGEGIEGITATEDGTPVAGSPFTNIAFVGDGATASDDGGGSLEVEVPGFDPSPLVEAISTLDGRIDDLEAAVAAGTTLAQRLTPLDANHVHAWELTETSGDFEDTGSSATKITLVAEAPPLYAANGLLGACPVFGLDASGGVSGNAGASALISTAMPPASATMELWFRSLSTDAGFLAAVDRAGTGTFTIDSPGANRLEIITQGVAFLASSTPALIPVVSPPLWHHVALVYDQSSGITFLYWDGEMILRQSGQSGSIDWFGGVTPRFSIAHSPNNGTPQFRGQLSRVRISDIARSQAYLREVYRKGMGYPA